jgi:AcrR family transcriptional regulator
MVTGTDHEVDPRIERTRRVVLEATADLVAEQGYDNTTIEGVSERCGVARSTIYRHWSGKKQLVIEAVKNRLSVDPDIDTGSVEGDIKQFLSELVAWFAHDDVVMIALSMLSASHRDPAMAQLHTNATRARRDHLVRLIERGVARGELPRDLDAEEAVCDLAGAVFYKKIVLHEDIPSDYVVERTERWLRQVGWKAPDAG